MTKQKQQSPGEALRSEPIAIVGVSALMPGSLDKRGFWSDILAGTDLVRETPTSHWLIEDYYDPDPAAPDKTYAKRGAFLPDVEFDPLAFGVPPSIVPATDTSQLLALVVAKGVLDDAARGQFDAMDKDRISVILGVTSAQELLGSMNSRLQHPTWVKAMRDAGLPESKVQEISGRISAEYVPWQEATFPGLLGNVVAGRIANRLDLGGTNCVSDAACASAFSALSMAMNELHLGQSDLVITGGVDTMNDIFMYMCFSKTPALSRTGDCRPFSSDADGTILGEGLAMVALKRLADAERDGDHVYAVIRGLGSSSDGRSKSVYAPRPSGQAKAVRRAFETAGYGAETVELLEAHGTATNAGDAAEFEGIRMVFDESGRADRQWCALGSVKSQIGHTKAAAGAAGLFKAVMALQHRVLPPTIKVREPNPKLAIEDSPFHLSTVARPWVRGSGHPRRAGVSSFGFGGSNFHIAVEEYRGPNAAFRQRTAPEEFVVFGGPDDAALLAAIADAQRGAREAPGYLRWLARSTQESFDAGAARRVAVVASDEAQLADRLGEAAEALRSGAARLPRGVYVGGGALAGDVAFLFPGQGSQYVGMGGDLAMEFGAAIAAWDRAADVDLGDRAQRLHDVVFPRPGFTDEARADREARLTRTEWAQPAIGVVSQSQLALLDAMGVAPAAVGGHSYGEVTALHAAGVLDAAAMVRVARRRGELMQEAARNDGAMTAVSADIDAVRAHLAAWGSDVVVANHNTPTQVVLSGRTESIAAVEQQLTEAGLRTSRLPVATAFHSEVVASSTAPFRAFLGEVAVGTPAVPVYANTTASPYPSSADAIRERLASQIAQPVRFVEQIEAMYAAGVRVFLEVGPGSVLTGLVKRILGDRDAHVIALDKKGRHGVAAFLDGVAQLAVAGVAMDHAALWHDIERTDDPRNVTKSAFTMTINGANYGKPYPPAAGASALPPPNPEVVPTATVPTASAVGPTSTVPTASAVGPTSTVPTASAVGPANTVPTASAVGPANTVPTASAVGPTTTNARWLAAYEETERQTAEAHAHFQRLMADAHRAYLQAAGAGLAVLSGGVHADSIPAFAPAAPVPATPQPVYVAPPVTAPVVAAPPPRAAVPAPTVPAPAPAAVSVPTAVPTAPAIDLEALLIDVVADATGYPAGMLSMEMGLEDDLGIDSIKRVEILSAMTRRAPGLPEVDTAVMANLRTLGEIVSHLRAELGDAQLVDAARAVAAAPAAGGAQPAGIDLEALLIEVVADATGYPAGMLSMEMGLEDDLGIDSIKRVEILSAMTQRAPGLPEVDTAVMANLRTLGEIVAHMRAQLGDTPAPAAAGASTIQPAAAPIDLEALLIAVVADATGYPAGMLTMEMGLEDDLGIDSIKRVEILSAMTQRAPGLPEVDTAVMATLRTLGEIVEHMRAELALVSGVVAVPAASSGAGPATATDSATVDAAAPAVGRFVVRAVAAPAAGCRDPRIAGTVHVTGGGDGVDRALAVRLTAAGLDCRVVDAEDVPATATAVVYLGGLRHASDAALATAREGFRLARRVAATMTASPGAFVTVQDTGGTFGLGGAGERAAFGALAALAKTASIEWPASLVRAIDVERRGRSADDVADAIAEELLRGGAELEVGLWADGTRCSLGAESRPPRTGDLPLDGGSVVVVSGGARGVTAACVVELARETRARFVLLGRTPLEDEPESVRGVAGDGPLKQALLAESRASGATVTPAELGRRVRGIEAGREIRETLAAIAAAGGSARYLAVSVTDEASLRTALAGVRKDWGPVHGVVHGAGVLADKLISEKTDEQFDRVFDTKVLGLTALLAATSDDPLRVICCFSSVAARVGNNGQVDYAMANEILNKVCHGEAARRPDCVVRSLGWGPWRGGMVSPALEAHFTALGVPLIGLEEGARMFVDELRTGEPEAIEIVLGGRPRAGALAAAGADVSRSFDFHVDASSHPWLADHTVRDGPVLPVVMAMEWMSRAARSWRPDLGVAALSDVRVRKGIALSGFRNGGDDLRVALRQSSNGMGAVLEAEIRGAGDVLHYTARIDMAERDAPPGAASETPNPQRLAAYEDRIYDGHVLFHGPEFQVLTDVDGIGDEGVRAHMVGVAQRSWGPGWRTDAAALDGGLQMAVLWDKHVLGGAFLPTRIGSYRPFVDGPIDAPIEAVLSAHAEGRNKSTSDIVFLSEGRPIAEMRGVETHRIPE